MDVTFSSPQYLPPGSPHILGCIFFKALNLSDQNLISQNFKLKKCPFTMCVKFNTKDKGSVISFILHDKLDGHTKHIVIADFFQSAVLYMNV
jgi:hypothetical protein